MDYKTQSRNNEKRSRFASVGTLSATDKAEDNGLIVNKIPVGSIITNAYAVVVTPFAAGSNISWGVASLNGQDSSFIDLDATVVGSKIALITSALVLEEQLYLGVEGNAASVASVAGEVKFVVEYTEEPVVTGKYT